MHRLVSDRIVIQVFHDVDFAPCGPRVFFLFEGQQPDSGPGAFGAVEPGTHLDAAAVEGTLALGVEAAGDVFHGVRTLRSLDGPQNEVAVPQIVTKRIVGHFPRPFGVFAGIDGRPVEIVFPDQLPFRRRFGRTARQRESGCRRQEQLLQHTQGFKTFQKRRRSSGGGTKISVFRPRRSLSRSESAQKKRMETRRFHTPYRTVPDGFTPSRRPGSSVPPQGSGASGAGCFPRNPGTTAGKR